jgi:hypothetical protein
MFSRVTSSKVVFKLQAVCWKIVSILVVLSMLLPGFLGIKQVSAQDVKSSDIYPEVIGQQHNTEADGEEPAPTITPTDILAPIATHTPTLLASLTPTITMAVSPTATVTLVPATEIPITPTLMSSTPIPTDSIIVTPTVTNTPTPTIVVTTTNLITPSIEIPSLDNKGQNVFETPDEANLFVESKRPIGLEMSANPAIILPDHPLRIIWYIRSWNQIDKSANVELLLHSPSGITLNKKYKGVEINDGIIQIPVSKPSGQFSFETEAGINYPLEFWAELFIDGELINKGSVSLSDAKLSADHKKDTLIEGKNGQSKVFVPRDASKEDLYFDIRSPGKGKMPPVSLTGRPVEIIAVGQKSKKNIDQFEKPLIIEMSYDEEEIWNWNEEDLKLFYYDEITREWWPLVTRIIDFKLSQII